MGSLCINLHHNPPIRVWLTKLMFSTTPPNSLGNLCLARCTPFDKHGDQTARLAPEPVAPLICQAPSPSDLQETRPCPLGPTRAQIQR
jgi:hypothetical protein